MLCTQTPLAEEVVTLYNRVVFALILRKNQWWLVQFGKSAVRVRTMMG